MKISSRYLFGGIVVGFFLLLATLFSFPDGKLHLVFCDVGQGDAIYVRTARGEDILIDGGPNEKVLSCLGKHMPFYDRSIELMILSHPQADHLNGLISVLERYNVNYFVSSGASNETEGYKRLKELIKSKNIQKKNESLGGKIIFDGLTLVTLWPDEKVLGAATGKSEVNDLSLVLKLSYGNFDVLLTGDAGQDIQDGIVDIGPVEVLKVPHHGSKTGLLTSFLERISPRLAVISVGKNSYGHPAEEVIEKLSNLGIKTLRTDQNGEIEIVSDGEKWWTKD